METADLKNRYIELFGFEPTGFGVLEEVERSLRLSLPGDFKEIAAFYRGGIVGGISHNATEASGPPPNIVGETLRLRNAIGLPHAMIAVAEPPASLIVMDTIPTGGSPSVIWLDATDARRLQHSEPVHNPQLWKTYSDFFEFLLEREEEERSGA